MSGVGMSRGWVCPGDGYVHGVALSGGGYVKRVGTHPPPRYMDPGIRSTSGRCISYWNAFLLKYVPMRNG